MTEKERVRAEHADALCDKLNIPRFADAVPPEIADKKPPAPLAERHGWFLNGRWNDA